MKRASNKPKRRNYQNANEYERDLKRWKGRITAQNASVDPSTMSNQLIRTILSENDILQAGCRELQNWRLSQFRRGFPVKKSGHHRPNLSVPQRFRVEPPLANVFYIASLPLVLWRNVILPCLSTEDVFALLSVSKIFYTLSDAELFERSRTLFQHSRASPLALLLLSRVRTLRHDYKRMHLLKLPDRLVRRKRATVLVRSAIERHGYIEHLRDFPEHLEQQCQAEEREIEHVIECMPSRVAECNLRLTQAEYPFIFCTVDAALVKLVGDWSVFLEMQSYVHMEHSRAIDSIVKSFKHPTVYKTLENCTAAEEDTMNRTAFAHLLGLISARTFFGRVLSDWQIAQYTRSILQVVRYEVNASTGKCCVWNDTSVEVKPMTQETQLYYPKFNMPTKTRSEDYWWLNHTTTTRTT